MSRSALGFALGCLGFGLVLGAGGTYLRLSHRYTKLCERELIAAELARVGETSDAAAAAYRHESKPVAIYALSQYLMLLQKAREMPSYAAFMPKGSISFDMMLAHARLANLYTEAEQSDLRAQHVAEALRCAAEAGNCQTITNQAALEELLARIGGGGAQ